MADLQQLFINECGGVCHFVELFLEELRQAHGGSLTALQAHAAAQLQEQRGHE